jgi:hypothetical protein
MEFKDELITWKLISLMHQLYRIGENTHDQLNAEKAVDKIQSPFMTKTLISLWIEGKYLKWWKTERFYD